jgi:CBS domain-containing protein
MDRASHPTSSIAAPSDLLNSGLGTSDASTVGDVARTDVLVAHPDETLRAAADRMASHWLGALPVVTRGPTPQLLGVITEFDLLKAQHCQLIEERHRERVLRFRRASVGTLSVALSTSSPHAPSVEDTQT